MSNRQLYDLKWTLLRNQGHSSALAGHLSTLPPTITFIIDYAVSR